MKTPLAAALLLLVATRAEAQGPARLHYQGRLVHGTNLFNGTVPIVLGLYTNATPTGGETVLYRTTNAAVPVVDGLYTADLGGGTNEDPLLDALARPAVYLQVSVNGTNLLPREPVSSAAYALAAKGLGRTTLVDRTQTAMHIGTNGLYGQATQFSPNYGNEGLFIECALPSGESSGLFLNHITLAMWTAGFELLNIYSEDDFSGGPVPPKLRLDSNGDLYIAGTLHESYSFAGRSGPDPLADLQRRVAELETRVAELERALAPR